MQGADTGSQVALNSFSAIGDALSFANGTLRDVIGNHLVETAVVAGVANKFRGQIEAGVRGAGHKITEILNRGPKTSVDHATRENTDEGPVLG